MCINMAFMDELHKVSPFIWCSVALSLHYAMTMLFLSNQLCNNSRFIGSAHTHKSERVIS